MNPITQKLIKYSFYFLNPISKIIPRKKSSSKFLGVNKSACCTDYNFIAFEPENYDGKLFQCKTCHEICERVD